MIIKTNPFTGMRIHCAVGETPAAPLSDADLYKADLEGAKREGWKR